MPHSIRQLEAEAQQVLNDLWADSLIPFALNVGKITKNVDGYTIHFYDSRIHSAIVPFDKERPFSETVRSAVLARAAKFSGPLVK